MHSVFNTLFEYFNHKYLKDSLQFKKLEYVLEKNLNTEYFLRNNQIKDLKKFYEILQNEAGDETNSRLTKKIILSNFLEIVIFLTLNVKNNNKIKILMRADLEEKRENQWLKKRYTNADVKKQNGVEALLNSNDERIKIKNTNSLTKEETLFLISLSWLRNYPSDRIKRVIEEGKNNKRIKNITSLIKNKKILKSLKEQNVSYDEEEISAVKNIFEMFQNYKTNSKFESCDQYKYGDFPFLKEPDLTFSFGDSCYFSEDEFILINKKPSNEPTYKDFIRLFVLSIAYQIILELINKEQNGIKNVYKISILNIFEGTKQTFDIRNFDEETHKTISDYCYFSLKDYVVSEIDLKFKKCDIKK